MIGLVTNDLLALAHPSDNIVLLRDGTVGLAKRAAVALDLPFKSTV